MNDVSSDWQDLRGAFDQFASRARSVIAALGNLDVTAGEIAGLARGAVERLERMEVLIDLLHGSANRNDFAIRNEMVGIHNHLRDSTQRMLRYQPAASALDNVDPNAEIFQNWPGEPILRDEKEARRYAEWVLDPLIKRTELVDALDANAKLGLVEAFFGGMQHSRNALRVLVTTKRIRNAAERIGSPGLGEELVGRIGRMTF